MKMPIPSSAAAEDAMFFAEESAENWELGGSEHYELYDGDEASQQTKVELTQREREPNSADWNDAQNFLDEIFNEEALGQ